jgi:hypothetical protein
MSWQTTKTNCSKQVYLSPKHPYQSRMYLATTLDGIIDVGGDFTWKQLARK